MTERDIMIASLKQNTFPKLYEMGFIGKYPHFKRVCEDHTQLIMFQTNKWGGSFTIEVSAIFPFGEFKNYTLFDNMSFEDVKCDATNERYRLPGMFDGWFYYSDLYLKRNLFFGKVYYGKRDIADFGKKISDELIPPKGYKLVWKFDKNGADLICEKINEQLNDAFRWMNKFIENHTKKRKE